MPSNGSKRSSDKSSPTSSDGFVLLPNGDRVDYAFVGITTILEVPDGQMFRYGEEVWEKLAETDMVNLSDLNDGAVLPLQTQVMQLKETKWTPRESKLKPISTGSRTA